MGLLDDPHGVSDETMRRDAEASLLVTAPACSVDGMPAGIRRHEVIRMAGEAMMLLGATNAYGQALHARDTLTQARETARSCCSTPRLRSNRTRAR